jgi:hypothetical protein
LTNQYQSEKKQNEALAESYEAKIGQLVNVIIAGLQDDIETKNGIFNPNMS